MTNHGRRLRGLGDALRARQEFSQAHREDGVALVAVIGVIMVVAVVAISLVSVTLFGTGYTSSNRVAVRVQGAAEAGLDTILSQVEGKKYNQLSTVCSQTTTVDGITVKITTSYSVLPSGGAVPTQKACPSTTDIVQSLTVTAEAETANRVSTSGGATVSRRVQAQIKPTPPTVTLDKALFGESTLTITNDASLQGSTPGVDDAHVYSNGGVTCRTQVGAEGSIYAAHGNLILENNCKVGSTAWASGTATVHDGSVVDGDLYAASDATWSVVLNNSSARIMGSVLTNGGIQLNGSRAPSGGIDGTAFARTGGIELNNQATIAGSAYAKGDIMLKDGAKIGYDAYSTTGKIGSQNSNNKIGGAAKAPVSITDLTNLTSGNLSAASKTKTTPTFPSVPNPAVAFPSAVGYPSQIQPPVREQFPRLSMSATDLDAWVASGYTIVKKTGVCASGSAASTVRSVTQTQTGPTVLVFEGCGSTPVTWDNADFTGTYALKSDLAIVSATGFSSSNELKISSSSATEERKLYLIVPADAPGVTWNTVPGYTQTSPTCSPERNIAINNAKATRINWMIYTPCKFTWLNAVDAAYRFKGQIYAGNLNIPSNFKLTMQQVPVPSLTSGSASPTALADMRLIARYDLPSS